MSIAYVEGQRFTGQVRSFNSERGWGFITCNGTDIMVHIRDCKPTDIEFYTGGQPTVGDVLTFALEPRKENPEHLQAKKVEGGTSERHCNIKGKGLGIPVEGNGSHYGVVKSFGTRGQGWITHMDGTEIFGDLADCLGSRPVTGDKVQFDMEPCKTRPGCMQARNITGGTAPLSDDPSQKIVVTSSTDKYSAVRNEHGHLPGCVCSKCGGPPQAASTSNLPWYSRPEFQQGGGGVGPIPAGLKGGIPAGLAKGLPARPGPYDKNDASSTKYAGGVGSLGRMY